MATADDRLEAARRYIADNKLDGLIAFSDGQNSFLEANAVFVLSGVRPLGESAVVIDGAGGSTLIVTPSWDEERAAAISCTTRTRAVDDLAAGIAGVVEEARLCSARLGIVALSRQRRALAEAVKASCRGAAVVDDALIARLARIRSATELSYARKAVEIAEAGYQRLLEVARPGVREFEIAAEIYTHMKGLGAEDNFLLMSASQHNLAVRAAGQRVLAQGDIILGEITPCYRGQFVQICRTAIIGEPGPQHRAKFGILEEAMQAGLSAARPGVSVAAVTEAMNGVFRVAGYGEYCRPPYMRVRGHGLGITSSLPGDIDAANQTVLEENMVFVMHPNQYIPETGYLMFGDTVVIGHNGAQTIANRKAGLDVIAA